MSGLYKVRNPFILEVQTMGRMDGKKHKHSKWRQAFLLSRLLLPGLLLLLLVVVVVVELY